MSKQGKPSTPVNGKKQVLRGTSVCCFMWIINRSVPYNIKMSSSSASNLKQRDRGGETCSVKSS